MKILHTESSNGWGGQEIRILTEAEGMRQIGHEVFFAITKGGKLVAKAREKGFLVYELPMKRAMALFTLFSLIYVLIRHHIQIVNTHSSWDAWIGGIAGRLARRKVVRTRHLSSPIRPGVNSYLLYNFLADFVVTTSSSIIPMIVKQARIKEEFCKCIPTGVNPDAITTSAQRASEFRKQIGLKEGDVLAGSVCVVRSWKGIKDLLQAVSILRDRPSLKWVIVGGGYLEEYKPIARELGIEDRVVFTGHLDSPYFAIEALDIFLLLSTANEGISQASLQAAYLEKPLITTTIGGLPEVCLPEQTGLLVPPFSPIEVAKAVSRLADSPELRKKMGENGKKLVLERFTLEKTVHEMDKVYQTVCKKSNGK